jgi:hypothetical protein
MGVDKHPETLPRAFARGVRLVAVHAAALVDQGEIAKRAKPDAERMDHTAIG